MTSTRTSGPYKKEEKDFAKALGHVKHGAMVGSSDKRVSSSEKSKNSLIQNFGCNSCSWRDTGMCPNGLKGLAQHTNRICSARVIYIKEMYAIAGTKTRLIQVEQLVSLKLLLEKMLHDYSEGDGLDKQFATLSKNIIGLSDKMRRQDEGIKIQGEIDVFHTDFRKVVQAEAKIIEEQNNRTRQAEFTEEVRPSG